MNEKSPSMISVSLSTSDSSLYSTSESSPSLDLGVGVLDLVGGHDFFPFVLNRHFFGFLAVHFALRLRLSNMAASSWRSGVSVKIYVLHFLRPAFVFLLVALGNGCTSDSDTYPGEGMGESGLSDVVG